MEGLCCAAGWKNEGRINCRQKSKAGCPGSQENRTGKYKQHAAVCILFVPHLAQRTIRQAQCRPSLSKWHHCPLSDSDRNTESSFIPFPHLDIKPTNTWQISNPRPSLLCHCPPLSPRCALPWVSAVASLILYLPSSNPEDPEWSFKERPASIPLQVSISHRIIIAFRMKSNFLIKV